MMLLTLIRQTTPPTYTEGTLYLNNIRFCFTLEDEDRGLEKLSPADAAKEKVHGRTAIPRGTYKVSLTMSARFGKVMPLLHDVPGFSGVRIHSGNTSADTDGCILVGVVRSKPGQILNSRNAFTALMAHITAAEKRGEPITIEVK